MPTQRKKMFGTRIVTGYLLVALWAVPVERAHAQSGGEGFEASGAPRWSLLAVGDTGRRHRFLAAVTEGQIAVGSAMWSEHLRNPASDFLLLGDNFYKEGLRRAGLVDRVRENVIRPYCGFLDLDGARSEEVEEACGVPKEERRPIPFHVILGNHDLVADESPALQREAVPEYVSNWNLGSAMVESREVTEGVSLVLVNWDDGLQGERLTRELVYALRSAEGPWVIIAAHYPIAIGKRGGLPRHGQGSHRLRETVLGAIEHAGVPVHAFLSGHHHSLQLLLGEGGVDPPLHLIAGSGARWRSIDKKHPRRRFGASRLGFVRVDLVGEGEDEKLVASLYRAPTIPMTAWMGHDLVAQYSIDRRRQVRDLLDSEADFAGAD